MNEVLYKHRTTNVLYHCQNPLEWTSWMEFVNKGQYTFIKNKYMTFKLYISEVIYKCT